MMSGWSGSPSRNPTTTSCPMRGVAIAPQLFGSIDGELCVGEKPYGIDDVADRDLKVHDRGA